ncbi:hypothetical protein, partial [Novacetimonas hansenii]|uniref:hypothetical protein n=1 Tax=Novacetimonas hansenii TaxID=436 RepID=UPI001C4B0027
LLKLFGKSFTKNLYNFRMLSSLTFQTVPQKTQLYLKQGAPKNFSYFLSMVWFQTVPKSFWQRFFPNAS